MLNVVGKWLIGQDDVKRLVDKASLSSKKQQLLSNKDEMLQRCEGWVKLSSVLCINADE